MHEFAIAQSIFEVVSEQAVAHHAARVQAVNLKIGEAHGIVLDSLAFSFEMLASTEPTLVGAHLRVETVPYRAHCQQCASDFPVLNFVAQCPVCHHWSEDIVSGTEFQICALELETATSV